MSTRVVDRVDEWDERPFTDGHRSLHEFADGGFSGVVRAGGAELYMTKGSVVGIRHGDIEDFESGGTAYEAASPALPLLAIMQETNDEVRAEYYSEETSISEVDSTLGDGGFTGYVELSDNVLSGDYYQVYHSGRSMSVGFLGESARLIDGDEAFETADDEVGIYQVRPADVEVVEIPEVGEAPAGNTGGADSVDTPGESTGEEAADEAETDAGTDDPADETGQAATDVDGETETARSDGEADDREADDREADDEETEATAESEEDAVTDGESDGQTGATADTDEAAASTASTGGDSADDTAGRTERSTTETRRQPQAGESGSADTGDTTGDEQTAAAGQGRNQSTSSAPTSNARQSGGQSAETVETDRQRGQQPAGGPVQTGSQLPEQSRSRQRSEQSAQPAGTSQSDLDLETRAIPSLDPERTSDPDESGGSARADAFGRTQDQRSPEPTRQAGESDTTQPTTQTQQGAANSNQSAETAGQTSAQERTPQETDGTQSDTEGPSTTVDSGRVEELRTELDDRDEEIERLESELDRKTTEYEDANSQLETLREEREELAEEVERLESELEQLETQFGAATDAERRMTGAEALAGTDIFPRYRSKGDATLKKAHAGSHRRDDVLGNLRLEQNTQFDAESVSVAGREYDEFLESTLEYRFVEWAVGNLLFEIRETGHEKALKALYDAVPVIDWADLKGTVEVAYTEDGQETRSQESFDIVLRNRMGEPLIVANLNDSREGATESMMEDLVRSAERVGQTSDAFAGAFLVTRSFFEPPALETADDVTKGGLLSRDKRKSFVNLSRKRGYHLCLVEARNENFTLLVPEL